MGTIKQHFEPEVFSYRTGTAGPQYSIATGSNFPVTGLYFDASTEETAYLKTRAINFGATVTSVTVLLSWYANVSTGDVIWGLSFAALTPNSDTQDIETKAFATEQTVTDSHLGTVNKRTHDISLAVTNLDSLAADDIWIIRLARKASAGGDTIAADCALTMCDISYADT